MSLLLNDKQHELPRMQMKQVSGQQNFSSKFLTSELAAVSSAECITTDVIPGQTFGEESMSAVLRRPPYLEAIS